MVKITLDKYRLPPIFFSVVVATYVISALAFESTSETAWISTLAIYVVFVSGLLYLLIWRRIKINAYVSSIALMWLYALAMSMVPNASTSMGSQIAYLMLTCTILCIMVYWIVSDYMQTVPAIILANIIGAFVLSLRIVTAYGGIAQVLAFASQTGERRIGGVVNNENAIGLFLAEGVLACLLFLMTGKRRKIVKVGLIAGMIILLAMILLTGSRKATVFAVLGIILFLLMFFRKERWWKKFLLIVLLVAVIIVALNLLKNIPAFSTIFNRFELLFEGLFQGSSSYRTDETRADMISAGLAAFWENPVFGNGTGYSYRLFGTYSHNNYVELLMNYGLIGFLIYYIPYAILLIRLWKRVKLQDTYAMHFLVYIALQLALGIGWVNYYDRMTQLLTAAAWGYLSNSNSIERRESQ